MSGEIHEADKDGSFRFEAVPGKYELRAIARDGRLSKPIVIDAHEKGVEGIGLRLEAGFEIRGHIVAEDGQLTDLSKLSLNFGGAPVQIEGNGNFHTNFVEPSASYHIAGLPKGWFVKAVSVGGKRIPEQLIEVEQGPNDVVFTLSSAGASLDVRIAQGGLPVVVILLVPETGSRVIDELPRCENDSPGECHMQGVPPGAYRIFALDSSSYVLAFSPDILMEKYRDSAPQVALGPSEHKTVTISPVRFQ